MRFPRMDTRDLEGARRVLPDDLPAGPRLVILPFEREQQDAVDSWMRAAADLRDDRPELTIWEVPTLSKRYLMSRFFIDEGMRAGIPDPDVRRHTLTAYTDVRAVAEALGLPTREVAYALLLDQTGEVVWRGAGKPTDAQVAELAEALATLPATPQQPKTPPGAAQPRV